MKNIKTVISIDNLDGVNSFEQIGSNLIFNLIELFSEEKEKDYKYEDLIFSKEILFEFNFFVMRLLASKQIDISPDFVDKFVSLFQGFLNNHYLGVTESEKLYDSVVKNIFLPSNITKDSKIVKKQMYNFQVAYFLVKLAFVEITREGIDDKGNNLRYFEHLKSVASIVLNELPSPNLNKVVIALLHDIVEDIPGFDSKVLRLIFGDYIADGVIALTKKPLESYLKENEIQVLNQYLPDGFFPEREDYLMKMYESNDNVVSIISSAKLNRQQDYFGHMGDLPDDVLDVKFADRIHNLRTIDSCSPQKQLKKVVETEKYFMNLARERNLTAYKLMKAELERIKNNLNLIN
ncbi:MAG: hypothetical protein V3575_01850 [Candidatus Absconditabacteria bacterium]